MDPSIDAIRMALLYSLMLATPILMAGLVVGLIVSLIQAVTQVQEQTLSFVPKIIAMGLVTIAMFSWLATKLTDFALEMFTGF
jgi:flagellar biosynthetic protein FliQ